MKEKKFIITESQIDIFIKYLVTKPYAEVSVGIDIFKSLPELPEINPKDKPIK